MTTPNKKTLDAKKEVKRQHPAIKPGPGSQAGPTKLLVGLEPSLALGALIYYQYITRKRPRTRPLEKRLHQAQTNATAAWSRKQNRSSSISFAGSLVTHHRARTIAKRTEVSNVLDAIQQMARTNQFASLCSTPCLAAIHIPNGQTSPGGNTATTTRNRPSLTV
jgi:hypothetical protein